VTFAIASDDLASLREAALRERLGVNGPVAMHRNTPTGARLDWTILYLEDARFGEAAQELGRALAAGARGYLLKGLPFKDLAQSIREVDRGLKIIQPEIATGLADHATARVLTVREIDVIQAMAGGNSNRRIAETLLINEDTVKGHVKNILAKLGARDRTHAVVLALQRGLIQL